MASCSALSGCNSLREEDEAESRICGLTVDNQDSEPHSVDLEIRDGTAHRFGRRFEVNSTREGGNSFTISEQLPIGGDSLKIRITVDGGQTDVLEIDGQSSETSSVFVTISESRPRIYVSSDCRFTTS